VLANQIGDELLMIRRSLEMSASQSCLAALTESLMMVREGMCFVVLSGQLSKVAMDVVGIATLGFELDGHVFDAEIGRGQPERLSGFL
jgi:hypothetical protein